LQISNLFNKKTIFILLIIFTIIGSYILYLNFAILNLKSNIKTKDELYKIQINNRINELNQLNDQLVDLQKLLNIGLDLSKKPISNFNSRINENDKEKILRTIPSGSPLEKIFITSKYGYRIHPIARTRKLHTGLDFKAKIGTEIFATADAVVLKVRNYDPGGYGKRVILSHNYGFSTLYAHMSRINVKEGDIIPKGTIIGLSGNSGSSTGPHLHYEIKFTDKFLDPINFVYWNIKTFNTLIRKNLKISWKKLITLEKNINNDLLEGNKW